MDARIRNSEWTQSGLAARILTDQLTVLRVTLCEVFRDLYKLTGTQIKLMQLIYRNRMDARIRNSEWTQSGQAARILTDQLTVLRVTFCKRLYEVNKLTETQIKMMKQIYRNRMDARIRNSEWIQSGLAARILTDQLTVLRITLCEGFRDVYKLTGTQIKLMQLIYRNKMDARIQNLEWTQSGQAARILTDQLTVFGLVALIFTDQLMFLCITTKIYAGYGLE
jgi:hypothetical protein